jgi:hypothetical protein
MAEGTAQRKSGTPCEEHYGYFIFAGEYTGPDGLSYSHLFLATDWVNAERTATALRLRNVGKLKGLYPADADVLRWAEHKGTPS